MNEDSGELGAFILGIAVGIFIGLIAFGVVG